MFWMMVFFCFLTLSGLRVDAQETLKATASWRAEETGLIRLQFPLEANQDGRVLRMLQEIASSANGNQRPTVVLQFDTGANEPTPDRQGEGSVVIGRDTTFERALSIARWLTGPQGARLRSIAYLPKSIEGHAVLVALACEEIAISPDATMGNAIAHEPKLDGTVRQAHLEVAGRRQSFPQAAVESMLDPSSPLIQVGLVNGETQFVFESAIGELRDSGRIREEKQATLPGQIGSFSGMQLRQWRWVDHQVRRVEDLGRVLGLRAAPQEFATWRGPWRPEVLQIHGIIQSRTVNQFIRGLEEAMKKNDANIAFIEIDSPGGSLSESLRLAQYIASLDPQKIQTIAYVSKQARGDASLIAMACDALFVHPEALLGGDGDATIRSEDLLELSPAFEDLARKSGRSVGELHGPVCPAWKTYRYSTAEGAVRWSSEEWMLVSEDAGEWTKGEALEVGQGPHGQGLSADRLEELHWIRGTKDSLISLAQDFEIESLPAVRQSNTVELLVQRLADQSWLPPLLITIGFIAFMTEMSTPGLGVPGFIAAFCFLLFFWIRFFNGTVEWLEISLFVGGAVFVAIELFVLPGFGIFGIGGIGMLLAAIVLASQTFIWPSNEYQLNQMAWNMSQVAATMVGITVGLFLIRNQLENLPMFRWMKLSPAGVEDVEALDDREAIVHWEHLNGKAGTTTTKCVPSGKARIGDTIVNVQSAGGMIEENQMVRVVSVRGNLVIVEAIT